MEPENNNDVKIVHARKIYEMLDLLRKRPDFSLTSKSISSLQNFLNGYVISAGGGFSDHIYNPGDPNFDEFKYWILSKGDGLSGMGNPYSTVLLKECTGDEEKAFDRFFEYLDEFKDEKKKNK